MSSYLRQLLRRHLPFLGPIWRKARRKWRLLGKNPQVIFSDIYEKNSWGDQESASGPGSRLERTEKVRSALPRLVQEMECQSLLDIPCGDFYWMKLVNLEIEYTGADIVAGLIQDNQAKYGNSHRKFVLLNLLDDPLPSADMVLCRDCLVHFSHKDILKALDNLKASGSIYLLTTTFTQRKENKNIITGEWRPVNLQMPPFNFPSPLKLIDETVPLPDYYDKHLGLWRISDLP